MSLNAVSVKINNNAPSIQTITYDKIVNVKNDAQQDYKIKNVGAGNGLIDTVSVKIKNNAPSTENITFENSIVTKVNSQQDYRVKSVGFGAGTGIKRIGELLDVDASNPEQGDSLVFNQYTQKYESRILNLGDFDLGRLDAGLF